MTLDEDPAGDDSALPVGATDEGPGVEPLGRRRSVAGEAVSVQLGMNVGEARRDAGLSARELARRAAISESTVVQLEWGRNPPSILVGLRLAGALDVSVDHLTSRVFWNPGEVVGKGGGDERGVELLDGYFSTDPTHLQEEASPSVLVTGQAEVAAAIGRNLRDARRRRRIPQHGLGVKQTHVSRIERGLQEANLDTLIEFARRLQVPVENLLSGLLWDGDSAEGAPHEIVRRNGRTRDPRSLDGLVARWSRSGLGPSAISKEVGVGEETVRSVVGRLRREGRSLDPDPGTWTPADVEDELALRARQAARASRTVEEEEVLRTVGASIRDHRNRIEMAQRRLAAGCAVPGGASTISKVESGGANFSVALLIRIAACLGVPSSALVEGLRWDPGSRSFLIAGRARGGPRGPAERIGANARRVRQASRLTEAAVAGRVGRRGRFFGAIERGVKLPRPLTLLMLASALEVEVGLLLEGVCDWYVRPLPPLAVPESEEMALNAALQDRLLHLWEEGADLRTIGEAVDMAPKTVFAHVDRLREVGVRVDYRKAPADPSQLSSRLRRRRLARGPKASTNILGAVKGDSTPTT